MAFDRDENWKTIFSKERDRDGNSMWVTIATADPDDSGKLLMIRFREIFIELWIDWNAQVGHSVKPQVGWKIDDRPRRRRRGWNLSTDGQATFMPRDEVMDMVLALSNADLLSIEVHPFGRNPISASFRISGFKVAVEPLLEALRQFEEHRKVRSEETWNEMRYW